MATLRRSCRGALGSTLTRHVPCCDCRLLALEHAAAYNSSTHALDELLGNSLVSSERSLFTRLARNGLRRSKRELRSHSTSLISRLRDNVVGVRFAAHLRSLAEPSTCGLLDANFFAFSTGDFTERP